MSGAIPLPLHVSITWAGTALPHTQNSMKLDKRFSRRPRSQRWRLVFIKGFITSYEWQVTQITGREVMSRGSCVSLKELRARIRSRFKHRTFRVQKWGANHWPAKFGVENWLKKYLCTSVYMYLCTDKMNYLFIYVWMYLRNDILQYSRTHVCVLWYIKVLKYLCT
jgi:hypothetical protein